MLLKIDTRSDVAGPGVLNEQQRILGTAKGLLMTWGANPTGNMVLHEVWLRGEAAFITMMRKTEVKGGINEGFTDAQYGEVYEMLDLTVREIARRGAQWRKRRGDKVSPNDIGPDGKLRT